MTLLHHLTPDFHDMFKRHPYSPQMSHTQIDLEDVCYKNHTYVKDIHKASFFQHSLVVFFSCPSDLDDDLDSISRDLP